MEANSSNSVAGREVWLQEMERVHSGLFLLFLLVNKAFIKYTDNFNG